ncbi:MAG: caspase family protein [Planctomycetaceae bacterium]
MDSRLNIRHCRLSASAVRTLLLLTAFGYVTGAHCCSLPAQDPPTLPQDPPTLPKDPPTLSQDPPTLPGTAATKSQTIAAAAGATRAGTLATPELIIDAGGFLGQVVEVAISPDNRLVAASGDKVVRIIDAASGQVLQTLRGDRARTDYGNANGLAFSPDGQFLLVGVHDDGPHGSIRVYRTNNFDQIDSLVPGMNSACSHVKFSRDGKYLATVDHDGQILIWDWPARRILKKIPARNPDKSIIDCLQFADAEPYLMAVEFDRPHIYRVPDGKEILPLQEYMPPRLLGWLFDVMQDKVSWPHSTAISPRFYDLQLDRNIWAGTGMGRQGSGSRPWVGLWTARTMNQQAPPTAPSVVYTGHRWQVYALAISPDGQFVVSGDKFGEVHIWDARTARLRHKIVSQGQSIYEAAFSTTNDEIVFGTQPDLKNWSINNYGLKTHVLNLKQRTIQQYREGIQTIQETPAANGRTIRVQPTTENDKSPYVILEQNGRQSRYRVPSGRVVSCYTLLDSEKLGVAVPVLFSDNQNLLAMWNSGTDELRRAYQGHESMVTSISPSGNGKIFVTGSTDRTIRIWSLLNHKPTGIFDFRYENSAVIEVKPGTSSAKAGVRIGDRILSVDGHSLDKVYELMLYDRFNYRPGQVVPVVMQRGNSHYTYQMTMSEGFDYVEPLLNVYIGDNQQWIIWTPQGYYDCSPGADQLIGWHVNQGPAKAANFFKVQQFRRQLYRPDIINRIIETGLVEKGIELANSGHSRHPDPIDLTDAAVLDAHRPPTVKIVTPATGGNVSDPRINIEAVVTAPNTLPITSVTLLHNGTPAKVFKPGGPDERLSMTLSHRLKLFPGRNEVAFIAENSSATSAAEDCRIELSVAGSAEPSKVYVLSIGIAEYANGGKGVDNLKFAADDATAFAELTKKHNSGRLYGSVETRVLLNSEASRAKILDGLQWLVDNVKQGDVAMLFCSGHGFLDDRDNFYLGSYEVDPERLRATAVSWREVVGILHEELPACQRMVFLDACHAEGIGESGSQNPLHDLAAPELGTIFYASCTLQQKSFEREEWRHGAFTRAILDVLGDKTFDISPANGLASVLELEVGVRNKVRTMTNDRQQPQVFSPGRLRDQDLLEFE